MKPKFKAFLLHLLLSILVFTGLFAWLLARWYPEPLFTASGGIQGLKIAILVDLVLGPLLSFVVYNPKKSRRELLLDYSVIALFQLGALAWGIYNIHQNRPVAIAWWDDRFYTVPYNALGNQNPMIPRDKLEKLLDEKIPLVIVPPPRSSDELAGIMDVFLNQGIPPQQRVDLYQPASSSLGTLRKHAVMNYDPQAIIFFDQQEKATGSDQDFFLVKLDSAFENILIAIDSKGHWVGYLRPKKAE